MRALLNFAAGAALTAGFIAVAFICAGGLIAGAEAITGAEFQKAPSGTAHILTVLAVAQVLVGGIVGVVVREVA